jgi:hypothetical protein
MSRLVVFLGFALVACGSQDGLAIGGDVVIGIGDEAVTPTVGAAIRDTDPDRALIVVGTRDISCDTDLQSPLRKGTYAMIVIDRMAAIQPTAQVTVIRVSSSGTLFNGGPDEVTVDQVEGSITGSVDFTITDETDEGSLALTVAGAFEVENCFP